MTEFKFYRICFTFKCFHFEKEINNVMRKQSKIRQYRLTKDIVTINFLSTYMKIVLQCHVYVLLYIQWCICIMNTWFRVHKIRADNVSILVVCQLPKMNDLLLFSNGNPDKSINKENIIYNHYSYLYIALPHLENDSCAIKGIFSNRINNFISFRVIIFCGEDFIPLIRKNGWTLFA